MYKVFTLCIFALMLSFSLQAQSVCPMVTLLWVSPIVLHVAAQVVLREREDVIPTPASARSHLLLFSPPARRLAHIQAPQLFLSAAFKFMYRPI